MQTLCERKIDLTVIVPVYNLEKFLEPLLLSLQNQELGVYRAEFIFVLNKCTDESERVIKEKGRKLNPIILYCTDKQGCGCARNVAIPVAQGDYIWFMDGDDWLTRNTALKDALDKAYGKALDILRIPFTSNKFDRNYFSMVWQYLLRRRFVEEFRFPDYQPCEDDEYMIKVLNKAGYSPANYLTMPHLNKVCYYYNYLRDGSNMQRHFSGEDINGEHH